MVLMRSVVVLVLCTLVGAISLEAQIPEDLQNDETLNASIPPSTVHRLSEDLALARRAGDVTRVRELEHALFESLPTLPGGIEPLVRPGDDAVQPEGAEGLLWGNDVRIYSGAVWSNGKRQLALDADTLGGIYVGINAKYQDTLSQLLVYRSTNQGRNWTYLSRFYSSLYPIQSFDMCVTDTTGGKWLIGFAFVLKTDKSANGGGHLYWGSVLNDGTDWRYTVIATATSSINFKNPSICTDGTKYAPSMTYHYVATEYLKPSNDSSRGLYLTRTTNWGKNWVAPDTSIRGYREMAPVIAIDWSTTPDSLCLAFTRYITGYNREIRMGRNAFTASGGWALTGLVTTADEYDPAMAIDPVRGNAIITYTRSTGAPKYYDAMYLYSTDLFKSFKRDSIAATTASEELTSVVFAPSGTSNYYWRVAYRSSLGGDTIFYKSVYNGMTGFYSATAMDVSQYRPTAMVMPVVGFDKAGGSYLGNCVYAGYGGTNVYFDAVDLYLDVSKDEDGVPMQYALDQNYPNPFNPKTHIRFQIPGASDVRLTVFDQLGREIARLVDERKEPGSYTVQFDGAPYASGIYFYRLEAGSFLETKKLVLLK